MNRVRKLIEGLDPCVAGEIGGYLGCSNTIIDSWSEESVQSELIHFPPSTLLKAYLIVKRGVKR